jgi:hypothetical protein
MRRLLTRGCLSPRRAAQQSRGLEKGGEPKKRKTSGKSQRLTTPITPNTYQCDRYSIYADMNPIDELFIKFLSQVSSVLMPLRGICEFSVVLEGTMILIRCDRQALAYRIADFTHEQSDLEWQIWCDGHFYGGKKKGG